MTNDFQAVEQLFQVFDQSVLTLMDAQGGTYLEGLIDTGENLYEQTVLQSVEKKIEHKLQSLYQSAIPLVEDKVIVRKAFQLAILKGMNQEKKWHYEPTPEAVSLFLSYLIGKFTDQNRQYTLLDLTVGSGNLAVTIKQQVSNVEVTGIDVDHLLLQLAYVQGNLTETNLHLFHQDSIKPLMVDPVDLICSDLPVGYYPDDEEVKDFLVKAEEGKTFIHHLFIEQSLRYAKKGAMLFFLIPNHLFTSEQSEQLKTCIFNEAIIQGLLELPLTMFKDKQVAKSILILQKKGEGVVSPKQALLASLPSFTNKGQMVQVVEQIDKWVLENVRK